MSWEGSNINAFPFADFMINPQTNWARFINPQVFISLNSADAPIENHVLSRAGSYGKQLGTLLDVVEVLAARLPDDLTPAERKAVGALAQLREDVESAKAEFRGEPRRTDLTRADVDQLLDKLEGLQRTAPNAHKSLADRLRQALTTDE